MYSPLRILAIGLVFFAATIAWQILGAVTSTRKVGQQSRLSSDVQSLWGMPQTQTAPRFTFQWKTARMVERTEALGKRIVVIREKVLDDHSSEERPSASDLRAEIHLDQRLKGMIWYSLYDAVFDGTWTYVHERSESGKMNIAFRFPVPTAMYDDFQFLVNGVDLASIMRPEKGELVSTIDLSPNQTVTLRVHYKTRGMNEWSYAPAPFATASSNDNLAGLRNFKLRIVTDFDRIDYPTDALSPSVRERTSKGWTLDWVFKQVLTGQRVGVVTPSRIQPGELAASLAHSAPVSLAFFFMIIFVLSVLRKLDIHPMNYLAVACAFFSFHLLFAYSVDHLSLFVAFALASVSSIILVVSYFRLVVSARFAFVEVALGQLVYQVGFSVAHFWDGYTGLTISILSTMTLFVVMQLTGRIRWSTVFANSRRPKSPAAGAFQATGPVLPTREVGESTATSPAPK